MWRVPYSYVLEFTGASALAANGSLTLPVDIDREADFALFYLAAVATSFNARIAMRDQSDRLFWDGAMPLVNMTGTGQLPRQYQAARVIRRTNQMRVTLTDASGAPNSIRLLFTGAQLFPHPFQPIPPWQWSEDYALAARFGPEVTDDAPIVPANGNSEFSIRTPGDAWFEIHALGITQTGIATLQLLNDGNREWFRRPVHTQLLGATDIVGSYTGGSAALANFPASWPFRFTPPRLLPRNTSITVRVNDLSGVNNAVRVTLYGMRRYPSMGG
jgi:hypothetical protein